jgi:proline iminopeptidase
MQKKIFRAIKYAFFLGLLWGVLVVLVPRSYTVPSMLLRKDTLFWNLPTGSKIAYTLVAAKGEKKPFPIIYLHGGPGGFVSDWTRTSLAPLADDRFDVFLYDQIGSGQSARLANMKDYTANRHKKDLEELIKKIGAEKVILIGQSWGAILAALYVADHPDKVEKFILTGPGPLQPMKEDAVNQVAPDSLNLRKPPYSNREANEESKNSRMNAVAFWATSFGKKLASDKEVDDFQTHLYRALNKATVCDTSHALEAEGGGGFYAQVMTVHSFNQMQDVRPRLKGLTIPCLLMKGQCDNQPWGAMSEYLELFPNHQLKIIPNAGHSISIEQPKLYIETIRAFLKDGIK